VLVPATVALDTQEAVLKQAALEIGFELLTNKSRKVAASVLYILNKSGVVFGNDGIQCSPFRSMPVICGSGRNLEWYWQRS
jgi:hypothetical protein